VRRVEQDVVWKLEQPLGQRAVERSRHAFHALLALAVRVEVRAPRVADQQGVAC